MPNKPVVKHPRVQVTIFDESTVVQAWLGEKVASGAMSRAKAEESLRSYESNTKAWAPPLKDSYGNIKLIWKLARDMKSWTGRVYFKTYKDAEYVIIKGTAGFRKILTGTRYKTTNPKIIELQIGRPGLKAAARESFVFGVILVSAIDVLDYFVRDTATLGQLFGGIFMDVGKVALASAIGFAAAAVAVGTVIGTFAAGPVLVAFAVGVIAGVALDRLDEQFHITQRVSKALDEAFAKIEDMWREREREFEAWLRQLQRSQGVVDLSRDANAIWNSVGQSASSLMLSRI